MEGFVLGNLYPKNRDGEPNLVLSSSYELTINNNGNYVVSRREGASESNGTLETNLSVNTDSVQITNIKNFVNKWLRPQLEVDNENKSAYQYRDTLIGNFAGQELNRTLESLRYIGYRGYGWDKANTNEAPWNEEPKVVDNANGTFTNADVQKVYNEISDDNNYRASEIWENYSNSETVNSVFDVENLKANIELGQDSSDLWYPRFLYTYKIDGQETTYPGPVLMLPPGDTLKINFSNDIQIPGLSPEEMQAASLVGNDSYGLNGGAMEGGMTSTNFHMHGGHVNATGFGDNVVSRFTTGQSWTTEIPIPEDHGQGSYWYHPHYHPAVNTQLYGGLSGFLQVGDPLAKVNGLESTPRNLAVLKTMDVGVNETTGDLELAAVDTVSILGKPVNRMTLFTVNGEFQPSESIKPGWQSLTLSNQDNNYYFNIKLVQVDKNGNRSDVPLYIYGEDGHQYPEIRRAEDTVIGYKQSYKFNQITPGDINKPAKKFAKADDLISMPSGKRTDILFYAQPGTSIEIESVYNFTNEEDGKRYEINNLRFQASQYQNLSSSNTNQNKSNSGPGNLGRFVVSDSGESLSEAKQQRYIRNINKETDVQSIQPTTKAEDYDTDSIPSVDLFEQDQNSDDIWKPVRKREMNYSVLMLVGPKSQWDAANREELENKLGETWETQTQLDSTYGRYKFLPDFGDWLGYENPDFINDHVFPNGNLNIAQLGTMEEWRLRNWNWGFPGSNSYFVGHPFHIHVNDYQVKDIDTGLSNKKNLEDVTMLNSSGYHYYNISEGEIVKKKPLAGAFHSIKPAFDKDLVGGLATTGANDTIIRMLFQDYLGTYVHHCHLLEHEDAGMMQVVTIVENTAKSWLVTAEDESLKDGSFKIYRAQDYEPFEQNVRLSSGESIERASAGDLTQDFFQDILLSVQDPSSAGQVFIVDGNQANNKKTRVRGKFTPYENSQLAPWSNAEDFTGDGSRDLITAGFTEASINSDIQLEDLRITAWVNNSSNLNEWNSIQEINPWENLTLENQFSPIEQLSPSQVSFTVGDFNLDNFNDYAIAYALNDGGLRVSILDGSVFSLQYQTGKNEGGYFGKYPIGNDDILADVILDDISTTDIDKVVLTAGFNSYAQSPIENLLVTTQSNGGSYLHTLQLAAGHFIAHSIPEDEESLESLSPLSEHNSEMHSEMHSDHGHGNAIEAEADDGSYRNTGKGAMNMAPSSSTPSPQILKDGIESVAPVISGALGQGALMTGNELFVEQGNGTIGNKSNSNAILNSSAQMPINLEELNIVNTNDLQGIIGSEMDTTFGEKDYHERNNITALAYQAYTNEIISPSRLSSLSARTLGQGKNIEELADKIVRKNSDSIANYYGGELDSLNSEEIIRKTYDTLYDRSPNEDELTNWSSQVSDNSISKNHLPIEILLATEGSDQYRVGLLSAGAQWMASQYMVGASINGSFSQGFQEDEERFEAIQNNLYSQSSGRMNDWESAQSIFEDFTSSSLSTLVGTPVSDTGFF